MSARPDQDAPPRIDSAPGNGSRPDRRGGPLILIGGNCLPLGHAIRAFLEASGATKGGRIIGLTTASAEAEESAVYWKSAFLSAGAANVEIPMFTRANPGVDAQVATMIGEADGLFLGGGDQVKLVTELGG